MPRELSLVMYRDQTGQYKPTENGTSWSTAVTQWATTILIKALEDSEINIRYSVAPTVQLRPSGSSHIYPSIPTFPKAYASLILGHGSRDSHVEA